MGLTTTQVAESTNKATEAVRAQFAKQVNCDCYGYNHAIAEMCYPNKFLWIETEEPEEPLTMQEQIVIYYQEQWDYYNELYNMVRDNGGNMPIGVYVEFLLDELQDGPYWQDMREQFGTFRAPEPEPEPEPSCMGTWEPELEPESETSNDDDEWISLNDVISAKPKNGA